MKRLICLILLLPVLCAYSQKWEKNYDYVDDGVCGLSKVKKDGKIGYVNTHGKEVIKLQFTDGLSFREGYAAVKTDTKWMYLDSTGKAITEAIFDDAMSFSNGLAVVQQHSQFGYINTAGVVVIPFSFSYALSFSESLAPAANAKGYWGFIDKTGDWVIKPVYTFTANFENGEARVMKGEKIMYIDKNNKLLHE